MVHGLSTTSINICTKKQETNPFEKKERSQCGRERWCLSHSETVRQWDTQWWCKNVVKNDCFHFDFTSCLCVWWMSEKTASLIHRNTKCLWCTTNTQWKINLCSTFLHWHFFSGEFFFFFLDWVSWSNGSFYTAIIEFCPVKSRAQYLLKTAHMIWVINFSSQTAARRPRVAQKQPQSGPAI